MFCISRIGYKIDWADWDEESPIDSEIIVWTD